MSTGTTSAHTYRTRTAGQPSSTRRREPVIHGHGDGTIGPLSPEQLESYEARGFHQVDRLLEPDELLLMEEALDRLLDDPSLEGDERVIRESSGREVRSVFEVHRLDATFAALATDQRLVGPARQILGSDVYVHQSRVNLKPGFHGRGFYWHSDFETWHAEDGMPEMRAISISVSLTRNEPFNGCLMVVPGSHRRFVGCQGETPEAHYQTSLRAQEYGVPSEADLSRLVAEGGIHLVTGGAGSAVMFDCNLMHGSSSNISPFARRNLFIVYNSVENRLVEPFAAPEPRPGFIAARA